VNESEAAAILHQELFFDKMHGLVTLIAQKMTQHGQRHPLA
jgi:hypothetical protein